MHWATILRNIFSNSASYLVTAVAGFLLAPIVVHSLGNTGYGLWTLVLSLTGYFGLLDLGIRSSVGRFVARYVALGDEESVNRIVSTAFTVLTIAGTLTLLTTVVVANFFLGAFHIEPQYQAAAQTALLITGLNMSCILPFGVFSAILIALERFDVLSGVTIVGEITRAALVITFLKLGHGLVAIALIAFLITAAQYCIMAFFVKAFYRPIRLRIHFVSFSTAKDLFGFGIYRFIWIVANQLIFYSGSVVIGIFLGAAAITYYAIAASLINYGRNIVSLVTDTLAPSAARMDAGQDLAGLQKLMIVGTKMALLVALPLCLGFLFLGEQFITLWMGKAYISSAAFLIVLTIPQFGSMAQYVSVLILAGIAKHRILAYLALLEGLTNLVLSIILVQKFGLIGVAWGTVIPHIIFTAVIVPLYTLKMLKLDLRKYIVEAYLRPAICALPIAALGYACSILTVRPSWVVFAAEAMAMCGTFAVISYFVCLDSSQRASVVEKIWVVFHREPVINEA